MSEYEADEFMEQLEKKWDAKHTKRALERMERKLNRKERFGQ